MVLLDTHIWVWWVQGDPHLSADHSRLIAESENDGLLVSAISCWEVAKLVEIGRLLLPCPALDWLKQALAYPGMKLADLSPEICVESTQLPGEFHKDPADQIIVATARIMNVPLVTVDARIKQYNYVQIL